MQFEKFMTGEIIKREQAKTQSRIEQGVVKSELKKDETTHKALVES